jgi:hypothetical protein
MVVIDGGDSDHRQWWKWRRLDFIEWEDIRLHDGENEMRGEGRGGMIGGGLKLYTKATSSIKTEDKGSNTVIPFYDHHKSRLVETMTFWVECHGGI